MELYPDGGTLRVVGQVDARCTADLRDALADWLSAYPGDAVLDLSEVEAVDLTALRTIAAFSRAVTLEGRWLRLRGCSPLVRRLLHLSHLRGLVHLDEPAASQATPVAGPVMAAASPSPVRPAV